ncbi:hypothetical protein PFICI_08697 [Pestalotiopsis fici W106-1]|uniref:Uncharacterized protein n=1 Tax=Pestalotiopsis fici (strain W106-1 / CGMCC3.15140) TaxID=1229662 RepID=W3WYJ3_PESFW|nr:uncharacterized protein PFICI_08697 [Pestalotiopsis fici W106-1]ETS78844.1 hypothetical protein PFICI_08697 [Pestalotiopsis fici W106-1]
MSGPLSPYPLFVLSKDNDSQYLKTLLSELASAPGSGGCNNFTLVTATNNATIPVKRYVPIREGSDEMRESIISGTTPDVVPEPFTSPFTGKDLHECAKWIRDLPHDLNIAWQKEFFCAVDKHCRDENTLLLVRRFESAEDGLAVHAFPVAVTDADSFIMNYVGDDWEDQLQRYQRRAHRRGTADRSVGVPFEYNAVNH